MKASSSFLKYFGILIFWLLIWEVAAFFINSTLIIVSPRIAFARLFWLGQTAVFWRSVATTIQHILLGFALALLIGIVIAVLSARFKLVYMLLSPAINVINAVPFASFIVLALFAMGASNISIFVPFVMVLPVIFHNTHKGIVSTDPQLLEMANVFRVPYWKKLVYIYGKSVVPFILSAAQVGIGFAWKSGISAELIAQANNTIGGNLHIARIRLETADLFAWTIAIVLLSYCMEKLFALLFRRAHI